MTAMLHVQINQNLYLKDPEETELGRNIVSSGITLINKLGLEKFTFKKLAQEIESTEASVYRYFENKYQLLQYLIAWYWSKLEFVLQFRTANIQDARKRLSIALEVLIEASANDPITSHVDEGILHRIVVMESPKILGSNDVSPGKSSDLLESYGHFTDQLVKIIKDLKPSYRFPKALSMTLISTTHRQLLFSEFCPGLSDIKITKKSTKELLKFLDHIATSTLKI